MLWRLKRDGFNRFSRGWKRWNGEAKEGARKKGESHDLEDEEGCDGESRGLPEGETTPESEAIR
jgi:hypothetical protein